MLFSLRRPDDGRLHRVLAQQSVESPTYPAAEAGASLATPLPAGYDHVDRGITVGHGEEAFRRAVFGLRRWEAHRAAGATVVPEDAPIEAGVDVVVVFRVLTLHVIAACRIVAVVDEPSRFGFAYGTLPIHPERGEEAFLVERTENDEIRFRVTAFSRPADPLARLGGPVSRAIQRRAVSAYLEGVRAFVARGA